jgi:hypothetical protein
LQWVDVKTQHGALILTRCVKRPHPGGGPPMTCGRLPGRRCSRVRRAAPRTCPDERVSLHSLRRAGRFLGEWVTPTINVRPSRRCEPFSAEHADCLTRSSGGVTSGNCQTCPPPTSAAGRPIGRYLTGWTVRAFHGNDDHALASDAAEHRRGPGNGRHSRIAPGDGLASKSRPAPCGAAAPSSRPAGRGARHPIRKTPSRACAD